MKSNFKIAYRIKVFHSYFKNGICTGLTYHPATTTKQLIKRFKLKLINETEGFSFYINTTKSISEFLRYVAQTTGKDTFEFNVQTNTPDFYLFTELPVNRLGELVYNSQSKSNTYTNGKVQLQEDFISKNDVSQLFKLKIHFKDIIKYEEMNTTACFEIKFKSRPTQWNYYIINKSSRCFDQLTIKSKSNIQFEEPQNVTLQNGQQALLFSSGSNLIPLTEVPTYSFDLVNTTQLSTITNKKTATSKTIFKGLPNPNPDRIKIHQTDGTTLVSSLMYVYV